MDLVAQSFNHRLTTGYTRNDFIQLLLQLREKGSVEFEDLDEEDEREKNSLTHHEQDKNVIGEWGRNFLLLLLVAAIWGIPRPMLEIIANFWWKKPRKNCPSRPGGIRRVLRNITNNRQII